jgi:hypothetical protein
MAVTDRNLKVRTVLIRRGRRHWNILLECGKCGPLSVHTAKDPITKTEADQWAENLRLHHIGTEHGTG